MASKALFLILMACTAVFAQSSATARVGVRIVSRQAIDADGGRVSDLAWNTAAVVHEVGLDPAGNTVATLQIPGMGLRVVTFGPLLVAPIPGQVVRASLAPQLGSDVLMARGARFGGVELLHMPAQSALPNVTFQIVNGTAVYE